jgi:hypothetical protein
MGADTPAKDPKTTTAYTVLTKEFGNLSIAKLGKLADIAAMVIDDVPEPDRAAKKSLDGIYLWFDSNWDKISARLDTLSAALDEEEEEEDAGEDDDQ